MAEDGHVLYARQGDTWVLRFEGDIRYTMAHAVDAFLDELFAHENPGRVCADLNATTAIDSTGIGVLAKIANGLRRAGHALPIIFSSNPDIVETLKNVCLDEVCTIVAGAPEAVADNEIPATTPSERELARTIVAAHCELCDMCEQNRTTFQSVVDAFERELKAP
jgi:anti-anti-sigma factor